MKTAYPRDVATKKHVDRVQDRLDRRIDLHGDKLERAKSRIADLEQVVRDLKVDLHIVRQIWEERGKDKD